jgi:DNA-3-methyladenine glycosylase
MFGPPGRLYVYFTYGMHWCANVVCGSSGQASAVLLRAGEPVEGIETMRARRPLIDDDRLLAAGPARLTRAMGIDKRQNGASLLRGGRLWCAEDRLTEKLRAATTRTRRIGLAPGKGDDLPWRFVIRGHPYASRRS